MELREKLYKAYISKASQGDFNNIPVIEEILTLKKEYAKILGYNNYAELSLSTKMADNVTQIEDLLNMLSSKSKSHAENDLQKITEFANKNLDSCVNKLQLWEHPNIFIYGSGSLPRPYYIHPTFTSMVLADVSLNLI